MGALGLIGLVDGGGSKTRVRLLDGHSGCTVAEAISGPGNLALGVDPVWEAIEEAVGRCGARPERWVMGLAGAELASERVAFLARTEQPVLLLSDRDAGLLGAHQGAPGVALTVGTGVALAWMDVTGRVGRRGGFGFVLGDEGGGAWLGRRLLSDLCHAMDRDPGAIDPMLLTALAIGRTPAAWIAFSQGATPSQFARLAPLVWDSAARDEPIARAIVEAGVSALMALQEGLPSALPVALVGGLASVYEPLLRAQGLPVVPALGDAMDGLQWVALGSPKGCLEVWSNA